jgi:hypothetical protein
MRCQAPLLAVCGVKRRSWPSAAAGAGRACKGRGGGLTSGSQAAATEPCWRWRTPSTASTSTSPLAMVSYSSDPFSSPRQDIDFILLLLLQNWIRCLYAYVLAPVPLSWSRLPNRDLVLIRVRTALSCAFSFAVCSRDVQRHRSFASIIRLFCFLGHSSQTYTQSCTWQHRPCSPFQFIHGRKKYNTKSVNEANMEYILFF